MFAEDDLLAISALQHFVFCPRRCGLVHLEQTWGDNLFTAEGTNLHERTHESGAGEPRRHRYGPVLANPLVSARPDRDGGCRGVPSLCHGSVIAGARGPLAALSR